MGDGGVPRLSFELQHESVMPLSAFTHALERLNSRFGREVRELHPGEEPKLYIAEIRKGSIVVDLVQYASVAAPIFLGHADAANTLWDFGRNLAGLLNYFRGGGPKPEKVTIADCDDARALMAPAMQVQSGGLSIHANSVEIGTIINVSQSDAHRIDNRAAMERAELADPAELQRTNVLFVWHQLRDATAVTSEVVGSPDRGIVAEISPKPLQVKFAGDEIKTAMMHGEFNPFETAFLVDVKVLVGPRGPVAYLVQRVVDTLRRDD